MIKKKCKECSENKNITCFELQIKNNKEYRRNTCNECKNKKDYLRDKKTGRYEKRLIQRTIDRQDPNKRAAAILTDARNYDSIHKLYFNLDRNFISDLIKDGCSYCEASDIKIGIDRIDNAIGHIRNNVVAACTRCNFIRQNMPYEAWIELVPKIKEIYNKGLFGTWIGNVPSFGRQTNEIVSISRD